MIAELDAVREYGTDRPCEIARIAYTEGVRHYVVLAFQYTDDDSAWFLTWLGEEGKDAARLPSGIAPSVAMLAAIDAASPTNHGG